MTKYADGRKNLTERIKTNELWYKRRHWDLIDDKKDKAEHPEPTSGYLFNCIINKHADAMDNYPEPAVLPRERSDEQTAEVLSDILPVVMERNNFELVYSDLWYTKLRQGTGIYGVFWDNTKDNGVGDIAIKNIDVLNFYFEPGIKDIQDSKNIFITTLVDNEDLKSTYPVLKDKPLSDDKTVRNDYIYDDNIDTGNKSAVVDWYYKKYVNGKQILHFVKFVGDVLLFASENDEQYANGWYEHGKYPFVLDGLFPVEGTPFCFGYIDVCKPAQMYIDKMDQLIIENAYRTGKKRWAVKSGAGINLDTFADWDKPIIEVDTNPSDSLFPLSQEPLDNTVLNARSIKVDELKETSGNRDFSQGSAASGVTAASAISALQEAGSKLSRDMLKTSYNAYKEVCDLCIELMRQFYTESRCFRITKDNETQYIDFDNSGIAAVTSDEQGIDLSIRVPIFDVDVVPQKKSPFSRVAQNELIKELYGAGFFNPQNAEMSLIALNAMDFDGKDGLEDDIRQNAQAQQAAQMLQQLMTVYPEQVNAMLQSVQQMTAQQQQQPTEQSEMTNKSDLARAVKSTQSLAEQSREKALNQASITQ